MAHDPNNPNRASATSSTRVETKSSGTSIAFIVGALVVAVLVLFWLFAGDADTVVEAEAEAAAAEVGEEMEEAGAEVEAAADEAAAEAEEAAAEAAAEVEEAAEDAEAAVEAETTGN